MKFFTKTIWVVIIAILPIPGFSQKKIEVTTETVSMSKGEQPAYIVQVPEANYDDVLKEWTKLIRQNTKSKVEEEGIEYVILGTEIESIINQPINIYSAIIKADSSSKLIAAFEIDSMPYVYNEENKDLQAEKTHHNIQHFMRDFAVEQYKNKVSEDLKNAEKDLKTKNKEHKDITKDIENNQKDIQESEQNIKNSQDLISSYTGENERKLSEINNKKESISSLSGDEELAKQAKDQLKTLEKEKRSIENKLEKENKNIVGYEADIQEAERNITNLQEAKKAKENEIRMQEEIVKKIERKLAGIK
ncbi:MAG: hypothetical protein K9H49_01240 [Bacteroidales bacterium]|nr:hypothetical protein [Bacteroidales bacterium]MCF8403822.1 hypothetical protein [Bacteroidales bacterium]